MKRYLLAIWLALVPFAWQCHAASATLTSNATACLSSNTAAALVVNLSQDKGGATLTLSGTWTGTISFKASGDGDITWTPVSVTPLGSTTTVTSTTANGTWQVNTSGFTGICMLSSASMTGSAIATVTPSFASFASSGKGGGGGGSGTVTTGIQYYYGAYAAATASIGPVAPVQYSGELFGITTASSDNSAAIATAVGILTTIGPGNRLKLPIGGPTNITSPIVLDVGTSPAGPAGGVILVGSGAPGSLFHGAFLPKPSSYLNITGGDGTTPMIQCLNRGGHCGLENIAVYNAATTNPFMIYTCGTPWIDNVMLFGKTAAGSTSPNTCAENAAQCPVNDGIYFGNPNVTNATCGDPTAGYSGYGDVHIHHLYPEKLRQILVMNDNANAIFVRGLQVSGSNAYPAGAAVTIGGVSISAYDDVVEDMIVEQGSHDGTNCNYGEALSLVGKAANIRAVVGATDEGTCTSAVSIAAGDKNNDITLVTGSYGVGVPGIIDANTGSDLYSNHKLDVPESNEINPVFQAKQIGRVATGGLTAGVYLEGISGLHSVLLAGGSFSADRTALFTNPGGDGYVAQTLQGSITSGDCAKYTGTSGILADTGFPCGVSARGAQALGTPTIAAGACSASPITASATGTLTTSVIKATPAVDPSGVTGYAPAIGGSLYVIAYPTADTVNFKVCNPTTASITAAALTMNWTVVF